MIRCRKALEARSNEPGFAGQTFWIKQLGRFKSEKRYLHMIAFITSQYNSMHDALIDHFIQAVQSANHSALSNFRETYFEERKNQGKGIRPLLHTLEMDVFSFINNLENTLQNDRIGSGSKVSRMKDMFDDYKKQTPKIQSQIKDIEHDLREVSRDSGFFDALETKSRSLQRKVTKIVCSIEVDPDSANRKLMFAIDYFKLKHGKVTDLCPMGFLSPEEQDLVYDSNDKFRQDFQEKIRFSI